MAVALARAPPGASAEQAVRLMHPFPILERFCEADVVLDGLVAVPAGTHAIIFTADLSAHSPGAAWPIFGAGPRACPGAALMQPLLGLLQSQLAGLPHFEPERGHRYSGRNNDDGWSLPETLYFIRTFLNILR